MQYSACIGSAGLVDTQRLPGLTLGQSEYALHSHGLRVRITLACTPTACGQNALCSALKLCCCSMESIHMLSALKREKSPREAWPKAPRIEYPEDRLVQSYYARNPDVSRRSPCRHESNARVYGRHASAFLGQLQGPLACPESASSHAINPLAACMGGTRQERAQ